MTRTPRAPRAPRALSAAALLPTTGLALVVYLLLTLPAPVTLGSYLVLRASLP